MPTAKTQEVTKNLSAAVNARQNRKKELCEMYKKEPQVKVVGSPFYRPYFGNVMPLQINGISVHVALDGVAHTIPKTFADLFNQRIQRIDSQIKRQGMMSDNIEEGFAGEVDLMDIQ